MDLILIIVILAIMSAASYKIYKEKKRGAKCVGCPYSQSSDGNGCNCNTK